MKKYIFLLVMACTISSYAFADGEQPTTIPGQPAVDNSAGTVLPGALESQQNSAQAEIDKKNDIESADDGIVQVTYRPDGNIDTVLYENGTSIQYSYEFDDNGNILSCTLDSGTTSIQFAQAYGISDASPDNKTSTKERALAITVKQKEDTKGQPTVVELYLPAPKDALTVIAKKPVTFDFKEIAKALESTSRQNGQALKNYEKDTSDYYSEVKRVFEVKRAALASAGIIVPKPSDKREAIDKAVTEVYVCAKNGSGSREITDFIAIEKTLRGRIVSPAREIYEDRVESAIEYANGMIDKLLSSHLALYLNVKKDKIDVIINLPKAPETTE